jgi:hypothetical protein
LIATEYEAARFYAILVIAFSSRALLLTSAGLFALLSNTASRRAGEMALRLARSWPCASPPGSCRPGGSHRPTRYAPSAATSQDA